MSYFMLASVCFVIAGFSLAAFWMAAAAWHFKAAREDPSRRRPRWVRTADWLARSKP